MKKIIVILLFFALLIPLPVSANTNDLMQYEPYVEGLAKSYTESSIMLGGAYTDNKEAVYSLIEQMKKNYQAIKSEGDNLQAQCTGDYLQCLQAHLGIIGGVVGAGIDTVKGFFNNLIGKIPEKDYTPLLEKIGTLFEIPVGYTLNVKGHGIDFSFIALDYPRKISLYYNSTHIVISTSSGSASRNRDLISKATQPELYQIGRQMLIDYGYSNEAILNFLITLGYDISFKSNDTDLELLPTTSKESYTTINNYIQSLDKNTISPDYVPTLTPSLVCIDTTYNLTYQDNNFYLNGEILTVSPEGHAIYNNGDCTLQFNLPIIQYVGDKVVEVTDDGFIDVETNEKVKEDGSPDCDGILCWVSNIFKVIGNVIAAITGLATSLIDGIFHLIVPQNLDFISDLFDSLKTIFTEKFAITTDIQNLFKSIFTESTTNPLTDLSFTLPATDTELSFGVFAVVDDYVPMIKRIISALLALMTLMYVYRKITGSGGVMEK